MDMQGCMELGINWERFKTLETLASFFGAEVELWLITACNRNGNPLTRHQPGGMGLLVINELIEYCKNPCTNFQKLGKWSSYVLDLEGPPQHRMRVLSVYHVGQVTQKGDTRYYQQHLKNM